MRALVLTISHRSRAALSCTCSRSRQAGVAIVSVLAVLTIMALLAMCFAVLLTIEVESSRASQVRVQSEMMAQSGVQHAMSLLRQDTVDQPGWDDRSDPRTQSASKAGERSWRLVHGANGIVLGRYAFEIEDESGKININAAAATSTKEQDQGVGTFEMLLSDGRGRGLPLSAEMARKAVRYRYGPDGKPGRAGVDDNLTASRYQSDEIDNNANGIVDEPGEGIDEPEEYSATAPRGDDRVFMSVGEMLGICGPGTRMDEQGSLAVRRLATVESRSGDTFWDDRVGGWQNRVNINVADRNQMMDVLTRANTDGQFEPVSRNLNQLGANIQDYRDQNHVLTTVGNEYGVESVCFNEVLAYDAGFTVIANSAIPNSRGFYYFHYCTYTSGNEQTLRGPEYRWRFASFGTTSISLKEPVNVEGNMPVFLRMDTSWPRDFWKDADVRIYTNADKYYTCKATGNPETGSRRLSIEGVTAQQALDTDPDTATVTVNNRTSHVFSLMPMNTDNAPCR